MRVSLRAEPGPSATVLNARLTCWWPNARARLDWRGLGLKVAACAAFAFLNNGRWQECPRRGDRRRVRQARSCCCAACTWNHLVIIAVAATTACLGYMLSAQLLQHLLPMAENPLHEAAFTSAILFLVPGFPLLTAALDLARFDFTSGVSRLLYASLITLAAALGAWLVAWALAHPRARSNRSDCPPG